MDMQAATKRIDAIVDGLLSLKQELLGTEPEVPQQTIDRKQRNQCVKCGKSMHVEIPVSEYAKLNQRVGFLEGLVGNLEMLGDDELRPAIERGVKRYQEIQSR